MADRPRGMAAADTGTAPCPWASVPRPQRINRRPCDAPPPTSRNTASAGIWSSIRARHARHARATSGRRRQVRQRVGHAAGREGLRVHVRPHTQAGQTVPVVRLVVAHGHHQLRDARGQPLGYRADAAVMDQRLAARQDLAEWHVRDMSDLWWERGRKLFRIAGHEQGPEAEPAAGFESHVKEPARLQVRRPGREQHRCVSGIQERREVLGHGNLDRCRRRAGTA